MGQHAGKAEAQEQSRNRAQRDELQAHTQDHAMNLASRGAERHENPDLARLTRNRVCNQAIDSERDQYEANSRKYREQKQAEARLGIAKALEVVLQTPSHGEGHVAIHRPDFFAQGVEHRKRIALRSHQDAALECAGYGVRNEDFGTRWFLNALILCVGDDADNLEYR